MFNIGTMSICSNVIANAAFKDRKSLNGIFGVLRNIETEKGIYNIKKEGEEKGDHQAFSATKTKHCYRQWQLHGNPFGHRFYRFAN